MLYERWREIAREHAHEVAVRDAAANESITFSELARAIDHASPPAAQILFPQGHNMDFVRTVLLGWKHGRIICPLEQGQPAPMVDNVPPGCAHLKLTSATTGPARLIAFREEQLFADAQNIVSTMGLRAEWPNVGFISLAHSYGFSNLILPLLLFGIPLTLPGPPLPETLRAVAKQMAGFTLPAVPAIWQAWHEAGAIGNNVRLAISAGAPLPLALETEVFHHSGVKIHNFYGSSECGGIAYDRSNKPRLQAALAGEALDNVSLQQTPEGLLTVSGAAVAETYWPQSNPRLKNGTFVTSDVVELKSGQVYLRGRATDLINVAGRKVLPESIEGELLRHPAVRDCVVFGMPDADSGRGECIAACVVAGAPEKDLREFLLAKLPPWQVPRMWHFLEALPRNERGKISRAELRRKFLQ
ncbi:MAG TPA: class I adenylate-forming enzyme family protein [Verrucomicrobiae bacterium]|nr:class I adenylate-forming enzyme family protein [Verrucomicrobiae bacterium]